MVIYITGHTRGLGKNLFDALKDLGHEVNGFSFSSGYDLKRDFDKIIDIVQHGSIFINNSYASGVQLDFIESLHGKVSKMIVMGSIAAIHPDPIMPAYSTNKKLLRDKFFEFASKKSNTDYLLLGLTSSSYKDKDLILKSILFWLDTPNVLEIGFNIDE